MRIGACPTSGYWTASNTIFIGVCCMAVRNAHSLGTLVLENAYSPPSNYFPRNGHEAVTRRRASFSFHPHITDTHRHRGDQTGWCLFLACTVSVARSPGDFYFSFCGVASRNWGNLGEAPQVIVLVPLDLPLEAADAVAGAINLAHFINSKFIWKTCCWAAICPHFCQSAIITMLLYCVVVFQ